MRYFNADGKESTMCGNGGRCMVAFAHKLGLIGHYARFRAMDGLHEAFIDSPSYVRLKMQDVKGIEVTGQEGFLNTGSPHFVKWVDNVQTMHVVEEGRKIRYHPRFQPDGTNVNFIQPIDQNTLFVRTYERGVEDETLSCGTGVTASAIFAGLKEKNDNMTYNIATLGGNLVVRYKKTGNSQWTDIWLEGPADFVFEGDVPLE
jgi:diaminopimelate epimerase